MREQLHGLTRQTAGDLKRLISHGDQVGADGTPGAAARGVTWVKVTGGADEDGWHPAVVSTDTAGVWDDGADQVLVAADNPAYRLNVGGRYLCTRTGDTSDDVARFRAKVAQWGADYQTAGGGGLGDTQSRTVESEADKLVVTKTVTRIPGGSGRVIVDAGAEASLIANDYGAVGTFTHILATLMMCTSAGVPTDPVASMVISRNKLLEPHSGFPYTDPATGEIKIVWIDGADVGDGVGAGVMTGGVWAGDGSQGGGQGRRLVTADFGDDDVYLVWVLEASVGGDHAIVSGTLQAEHIGEGGTYILWRTGEGMLPPELPPG